MQHLLIPIVILLILGLTYTAIKWPGGLHATFSQHAATSRWSKIFYAVLFLITLPMLMLFFSDWFVPEYNLPATFLWFAGIAVVFQIACTFVPEEGGVRTMIHRILTGISGVAMLPLIAIIALAPSLSYGLRTTAVAALFVMALLLCIALANQKGFRWALLLQVGYYGVFFFTILAVTYSQS